MWSKRIEKVKIKLILWYVFYVCYCFLLKTIILLNSLRISLESRRKWIYLTELGSLLYCPHEIFLLILYFLEKPNLWKSPIYVFRLYQIIDLILIYIILNTLDQFLFLNYQYLFVNIVNRKYRSETKDCPFTNFYHLRNLPIK